MNQQTTHRHLKDWTTVVKLNIYRILFFCFLYFGHCIFVYCISYITAHFELWIFEFGLKLKSGLSHQTADDNLREEGQKEGHDHNGGAVGHPFNNSLVFHDSLALTRSCYHWHYSLPLSCDFLPRSLFVPLLLSSWLGLLVGHIYANVKFNFKEGL